MSRTRAAAPRWWKIADWSFFQDLRSDDRRGTRWDVHKRSTLKRSTFPLQKETLVNRPVILFFNEVVWQYNRMIFRGHRLLKLQGPKCLSDKLSWRTWLLKVYWGATAVMNWLRVDYFQALVHNVKLLTQLKTAEKAPMLFFMRADA